MLYKQYCQARKAREGVQHKIRKIHKTENLSKENEPLLTGRLKLKEIMKLKNRIKEPKELIEQAIQKDDVGAIPDIYDEDAYRFEMDRKYQSERWDR